jgi:hypothetical protein
VRYTVDRWTGGVLRVHGGCDLLGAQVAPGPLQQRGEHGTSGDGDPPPAFAEHPQDPLAADVVGSPHHAQGTGPPPTARVRDEVEAGATPANLDP